jgi:membrane protease YdiL (CAAX protease family)
MDRKRSRLIVAWLAVAIASDAADIAWELHSGQRLPLAAGLIKALVLIPLALGAREYLRTFIVTLIASSLGTWLGRTATQNWGWFQHASVSNRMYVFAWLGLIPSILIALTLMMDHLKPAEIYLAAGNPKARVAGLGKVRWNFLAPVVICFLVFGLSQQLRYILGNAHVSAHRSWLAIAALALSFAAINAANEEFRFRFVLLARGRRAVGAGAALWMTSLNFGLAHYLSGHPGGPTGLVSTTLFAMLLCRSLYDTEGGLWAWLIHMASDIIIFAVVVLSVG